MGVLVRKCVRACVCDSSQRISHTTPSFVNRLEFPFVPVLNCPTPELEMMGD